MKIHKQVTLYKLFQKLNAGDEITAIIAYGTRDWRLNDETVFNVSHSLYINLWFIKLAFHWDKKYDNTRRI